MTKKQILAGAIAAGMMTAASVAYAPAVIKPYMPIFKGPSFTAENPLEKIAKENEIKFLKILYSGFPYFDEVPDIVKHAKIFGLEPELLMAVRLAENGSDSLAYGVMHNGRIKERYENDTSYIENGISYSYNGEKEKQLHWAAQTIRYYLDEFQENPKNRDFISYLGKRYAPIGASNDPYGLNRNWEGNVKRYYKAIKK